MPRSYILAILAMIVFLQQAYSQNYKIAIRQQPTNTNANSPISPAIIAEIQDVNDNLVKDDQGVLEVIIVNRHDESWIPETLTIQLAGGIGKISDLRIPKPGNGYKLILDYDHGVAKTKSDDFNIVGPATKLAFGIQPLRSTVNQPISPAVTVLIQDSNGNTVPSADRNITISLNSSSQEGQLHGALTVESKSGVATFGDLWASTEGSRYTLFAEADSTLITATSTPFDITKDLLDSVRIAVSATGDIQTAASAGGSAKDNTISNGSLGIELDNYYWNLNGLITLASSGDTVTNDFGSDLLISRKGNSSVEISGRYRFMRALYSICSWLRRSQSSVNLEGFNFYLTAAMANGVWEHNYPVRVAHSSLSYGISYDVLSKKDAREYEEANGITFVFDYGFSSRVITGDVAADNYAGFRDTVIKTHDLDFNGQEFCMTLGINHVYLIAKYITIRGADIPGLTGGQLLVEAKFDANLFSFIRGL